MISKKPFYSRPASVRAGHYLIIVVAVLYIASLIGGSALADSIPTQPDTPEAPAAVTSPFGVEMTPVDASGGLNKIKTTRTYFVRGPEVLWNEIQPTNSTTYDWSKLDPVVVDINNAKTVPNAEPIVVIRGTPSWAQKISGKTCGPMKASNYDEFATFAESLIAELASRGITIKYWEIWNEPDVAWDQVPGDSLFGCWGNQADTSFYGGKEYGQMLSYVYPKIKASSPNDTKVIIGGLQLPCDPYNPVGTADCIARGNFLQGIIDSGGAPYFDGVAFHAYDYWSGTITTPGGKQVGTYTNANWPSSGWNKDGPSMIAKAQFVRSILLKNNIFGKVILNTEVSMIDCDLCWTTNPYPADLERTLANHVVQSFGAAIGEGLHAQIWYDVTGTWMRNNGLLELYTNAELDSFKAYKEAAYRLDGTLSARRVVEYPGINGYEYDIGGGKHIWLLWSSDGETRNLISPILPDSIHDIFGVVDQSPNTVIEIDKDPVYIQFPAKVARQALPFVRNYYPYNYILNAFENGWLGWQINQTNSNVTNLPVSLINIHPPKPNNPSQTDPYVPLGTVSAYLGNGYLPCAGVPVDAYAELVTTPFVVPPFNYDPLNMVFQYVIYSQDYWNGSPTSLNYDNFEVWIEDTTAGTPPTRVFRDGNRLNDLGCKWWRVPGPEPENERKTYFTGWATGFFDLKPYIDHTVKVYFRVYNRTDNYFNTYAFLDYVVIRVGPVY